MENYDFNKLKLLSHTQTEFIPVEDIIKDSLIRHQKYPFIDFIKTEIFIYENIDGKHIKKTIEHRKSTAKSLRLKERYTNFKPFGKELEKKKNPIIDDEININLSKKLKTDEFKIKNKNITYKNTNYTPQHINIKKTEFKKSNYVPSSLLQKVKENENISVFKLIIKNIPTYYKKTEIEPILKNMLNKFGPVKNIKILNDKTNSKNYIKDLAFIEFLYMTDTLKLLNSNEKLIIDNSILLIEKCK